MQLEDLPALLAAAIFQIAFAGTPSMNHTTEKCYTLQNAEEARRENPRTFSIPRSDQRNNLALGQEVKLIFSSCTKGFPERMWVIVMGRTESGYIGKLDNSPASIESLSVGDAVVFGPEHVIAFVPMGEQLDLPFGQSAKVSPEILRSDAWPMFATRSAPNKAGDSGWRIFSSPTPHSDEQLVEASVDELIAKFQVLDSILDEPGGTSWLWSEKNLEFAPSK